MTETGRATGASPNDNRLAWLTVLSLGLWLLVPLSLTFILPSQTTSEAEKRFLAEFPEREPGIAGLSRFVRELDTYVDDHLAFRDPLISLYSRAKVGLFGSSPSSKLIVGIGGWFFLNDPFAVSQYRRIAPLSAAQLETWKRVLEERRNWLRARNIEYLVVLVPDKHQI